MLGEEVDFKKEELFPRGLYGSGILSDEAKEQLTHALQSGIVDAGPRREGESVIIGPDDL
jgi:hypothetical protein